MNSWCIIFNLLFAFIWNVEITTVSPFWYHGSNQSHEITQLSGAAEVQSHETCGVWPTRPKDINTNGSRVRAEGMWSSSPHMNVSLDIFSDSAEDDKTVTAQSTLSDYISPVSSRLRNGLIHEHVEKGTKSEATLGCRLFGIDLLPKNSQTTAPPPDREPEIMMPIGKGPSPTTASESDRVNNLDASMSSKEQKQITPDASLRETHSKQGSSLSMRTRTKVKCMVIAASYWIVLLPASIDS